MSEVSLNEVSTNGGPSSLRPRSACEANSERGLGVAQNSPRLASHDRGVGSAECGLAECSLFGGRVWLRTGRAFWLPTRPPTGGSRGWSAVRPESRHRCQAGIWGGIEPPQIPARSRSGRAHWRLTRLGRSQIRPGFRCVARLFPMFVCSSCSMHNAVH